MNIKTALPSFKKLGIGNPKQSKLFLSILPSLKEKRAKQTTALALSLITISFFGLFAISPTLGTISDLQKQLDDDTYVHQSLETKIANLTKLQQLYADLQDTLSPVYDAVPTSSSIDIFIGQLHTLAAMSNVQLTRVQTLPVDITLQTDAAKYTTYEFSLEAQGEYSDLVKYITNLSQFNRLVSIESISIGHSGKVDTTFRMQIRGKTYFKS